MSEINWKSKYTELKSKYMNSVDAAFRLGIEQGIQQSQMQQMQDQQAQQQAQQGQEQQGQEQQGQPGEEAPQQGQEQPASEHPQGSELDQHISQLEGMLGKSELTSEDMAKIKKSLADLKFDIEMKKSDLAVRGIAKSLAPKPFTFNKVAQHNLTPTAKQAVVGQHKIVSDIMSAWESQEASLSKDIIDIVAGEGLKKD